MKRKNLLAFILTLIVLVGLMTPWASAATFSDMEGHWAESYVEDVYSQGLASGYTDGTFRPDNKMTYCEALLFCSRVTDLAITLDAQIATKWYSTLLNILPSDISSWASSEMAICLELGIITVEELTEVCNNDKLTSTITREVLSMYLARAMQLEPLALSLSSYNMTFGDTSSVGSAYRPYVYLLNSYGIIQGDEEGNFNPQGTLSRGEMATLLSRSLELMTSKSILVELTDYADYDSWFGGTITSTTTASSGITTLLVESEVYGTKSVVVPLTAHVYDFNMLTTHSAFEVGDYVRFNYNSGGSVTSAIIGGTAQTSSGTLFSITQTEVTILTSDGYETFELDRFTAVSAGDQTGDYSIIDITSEYTDAQCTVNQLGAVTDVVLAGGTQKVEGIFSAVSYGTDGTLKVQILGFDGILRTYDTASDLTVTVDGSSSFLYSSLSGDYIALFLDNDTGLAEVAQVDTVSTYIQGAIKTYDEDDDPRDITIKNLSTSTSTKYEVSDWAVFSLEDESITMDELTNGWFITALFDDDDDQIVQIWCATGSYYEAGTITSITYGSTTVIEVTLTDGTSASYSLDIADLPTIYRDGESSSIDKIRTGDFIDIEVEYNEVTWIETTSQSANLYGTIASITKNTSGTSIEVEISSSYTESYSLSSSVSVTWDDEDASVNDLEVGYEISMVVINGSVATINIEDSPTSTTFITGSILSTDYSTDTFLVIIEGTNTVVTVDVDDAIFLKVSTGTALYFTYFDPDDSVQIYGSYSGSTFYATYVMLV